MKQSHIKGFLASLLVLIFQNNVCAQDVELVTFDDCVDYSETNMVISSRAKARRTSNKRCGFIKVNFMDGNMPDSLKYAIEIAQDVWSSYMHVGDSLILDVYFNNTINTDVQTSVSWAILGSDTYYHPMSLYRSMNMIDYTDKNNQVNYSFDAKVTINSDSDWCIGSCVSDHPKKLLFAMLQCMGKGLGYTSTIKKDSRGLKFSLGRGMSIFDAMIFSEDDKRMENLSNHKQRELTDFGQQDSGYLYVMKKSDPYKIYAPKIFEPSKSLNYSLDPSSIMYYGNRGDCELIIDDVTLDILHGVGWGFDQMIPRVEIIGENIDSTGIASAYENHRFYLKPTDRVLSDHQWYYMLPLKEGGYDTIMTSSNTDMIIPAITSENLYKRTIEGDIRALITYSGKDGEEPVSGVYNLTLELKPLIEVCGVNLTSNPYDDTFYDVVVDVSYKGCHSLLGYVEEEYTSSYISCISNTPYYTQLRFNAIDSWGTAWIHIEANNTYGSTTYVYEIPAGTEYANGRKKTKSFMDVLKMEDAQYAIEVYDISGQYFGTVHNKHELAKIKKSPLILKIYTEGEYIRTIKYSNR